MGLFKAFSTSTYDRNPARSARPVAREVVREVIVEKSVNPDPWNCYIKGSEQLGDMLVVEVVYPDCTTFEGHKILVYENVTVEDLDKQKHLDPHFASNKRFHSPIARFEPTALGRRYAKAFAEMVCGMS
jgi:hypothetical protein